MILNVHTWTRIGRINDRDPTRFQQLKQPLTTVQKQRIIKAMNEETIPDTLTKEEVEWLDRQVQRAVSRSLGPALPSPLQQH
jgi:hypothetical protein